MTVTAPNPAPAAEVPESSGTRLVDRVFKMRELAILAVFLVMIALTQAGNSEFLSEQGIKDLLLNATILVLVATGQSLVVITRNVDLSVGSTLGISAFAAGTYLQGGGNPVVAIVLAVLLGVGFGLLNGLLVSLGQVPALVVTLGTLYIIRASTPSGSAHARSRRPTSPAASWTSAPAASRPCPGSRSSPWPC